MPYKRVNPVDETEMVEPASTADMNKHRYDGHFTICQKLREIYLETDSEKIKMDCRIATAMAKKMHEKLKWYRVRYDAEKETDNG